MLTDEALAPGGDRNPDVVAQIFLGRIARRDDPVIALENPGARFPAIPISVAHRAHGSGTTAIFALSHDPSPGRAGKIEG